MEEKPAAFEQTRWSLVALAAGRDGRDAETALNEICQLYWYPLYAWLRRTGKNTVEAEDITQEFLAWFVAKRHLEKADPSRGKLRSFMLSCLKHFVADQYRKQQRLKRGGGIAHVSIDAEWAEGRLRDEPSSEADPDAYFDRGWARSVFELALGRLREFFESKGQPERFDVLRPFLTGEASYISYAQAAAKLAITEGAAKGMVHRMRERFKELLTNEVRETLAPSELPNLEEEIGYLIHVLSAA